MPQQSLEQRVERLEVQIAEVLHEQSRASSQINGENSTSDEPGPDDWKSTVGMFRGDLVFKEMIDEAVRLRDAERLDELHNQDQDAK